MSTLMLLPLFLSVVLGLTVSRRHFSADHHLAQFAVVSSLFLSATGFLALFSCFGEKITLLYLGENLRVQFRVDGLGVIFGSMVCFLWPVATYYAKTYMKHEGKFRRFFTFYLLTFGVVLGLALSDNLFTLYIFYELLTIVTLPLVIHNEKSRDRYAGRIYVAYMIFGASITFAGMMLFLSNVGSFQFSYGGITPDVLNGQLLWGYLLLFFGFGVKAGVFPFHNWLLVAGVAPTTVSSLLHAVAVVKSGAFAIMRLTFYLYDPNALNGTIVQQIALGTAMFTVIFGSFAAMRSQHLKRRLAYSTVSQVSYIVMGTVTMSTLGLKAALLHLLFHGFTKIVLFYVAGNLIFTNGAHLVSELRGYGRVMKSTFYAFTLCGLGLIGIPPLGGFFSKYGLAESLIASHTPGAFFGVVALVLSAFFTAVYIFEIIYTAYFPGRDFLPDTRIKPAPRPMRITLVVLTTMMMALSLFATYLLEGIDYVLKAGG